MNMTATTMQTNVIVMTDARVARGQAAWSRIKATAAEQRELWREVGEALLVGRKANKADQKFSQWCRDHGFGDMKSRTRSAAMWLATNWSEVTADLDADLTHPVNIQEWHREQAKTPVLPVELAEVEAEKVETIELDQRSAERVAKVINRAKANDEGSETAKRHVEALAKKHGTTPEKLEEAAAAAAPFTYHQYAPAEVEHLGDYREGLLDDVKTMLADGYSKDEVIHLYMNVILTIKKEF